MEGVEEEDRPRKLWKGPLWVDPTLDSRVPFAGKTVVVPKPLPDSYPNPKEGEGVTQTDVNPTESEEEVQVKEAEKEEFWVPGTGRASQCSRTLTGSRKTWRRMAMKSSWTMRIWSFQTVNWNSLKSLTLVSHWSQVTDWEDLNDIRNIYWIGKPLERRHHPGRTD